MENPGKRPLDDDPRETDGDDRKRLKVDDFLKIPSFDDIPIPKVKDPKKWKMLPAIVYELYSLFKSNKAADEQQKKVPDKLSYNTKEESIVLPNQTCEEKCIVLESANSNKEDNYSKISKEKSSSSSELLSSTKSNNVIELKSVEETLKESKLFSILTKNDGMQIKMTSSIKTNPVIIENNVQNVKTGRNEGRKIENVNENIENTIPKKGFSLIASTSMPSKIDVKKSNPENSITENIFILAKRGKILNLLKNLCTNGMAEIPTSKPPACVCVHCIYVDNLPIEKSAVNQRFKSNTGFWHQSLKYRDVYSSSQAVSDCSVCASKGIYTTNDCSCIKLNSNYNWVANTESSRNIWIKNLTSLIRKNDEKFNVPETKNKSSYVKNAISKVKETAQQIKAHISFCKVCKKFRNSEKSGCKCTQYLKKDFRYTKYGRY